MSSHRKHASPSDKIAAATAGTTLSSPDTAASHTATSSTATGAGASTQRGYRIVGAVFALMLLALLAVRFQYGSNVSSHVGGLNKKEAALGLAESGKLLPATPVVSAPAAAAASDPPPAPKRVDAPPAVASPPSPPQPAPQVLAADPVGKLSSNYDDVDVSGIQPLSQQALFDRRKNFGPMKEDPHPRDPAVDGKTPPYKGPKRGTHYLPVCQFNAKDAATAMKEDPNYILPVPQLAGRGHLPRLLQCEGLKRGVELGVKQGRFAHEVLGTWKSSTEYWLVDLWEHQKNYIDDANVDQRTQNQFMRDSLQATAAWRHKVKLCHNYTTVCATRFPDRYFDFMYLDARHDRLGVLADLESWWPKLRRGGLICGHDYVVLSDIGAQDWTVNFDGSRDQTGLIVRGAVDDFFMTPQARAAGHYRQAVPTMREGMWNSFCVRK